MLSSGRRPGDGALLHGRSGSWELGVDPARSTAPRAARSTAGRVGAPQVDCDACLVPTYSQLTVEVGVTATNVRGPARQQRAIHTGARCRRSGPPLILSTIFRS